MSAYSDDLRVEFLGLRDGLVADFQADGLIFAEQEVALIEVIRIGGDPASGIPATESETRTVIIPRPAVVLKQQWRTRDGAAVLVGDGLLTITRAVTEAQLKGAAWVEVGGVRFTFVEGELRQGALDWQAVVQRAEP